MRTWNKRLFAVLMSLSVAASIACSQELTMSKQAKAVINNPHGTEALNGVTSLQDYVVHEEEIYDWLFQNHPIFTKYGGKTVGKMGVGDRGKEWLGEGHGYDFSSQSKREGGKGLSSMMYRVAEGSVLKFPNKFIGPNKCGECHPAQWEAWSRSRHSTTIRFPGEHPEFNNNLTDPVFSKDTASVLPQGITPDVVYCSVGHVRTKLGYIDAWLLRGTYHVEGGLLKDGTGKIVAGGNQFQTTWALRLTPEVAKKIREWVPDFPVTLEEYGVNGGYVRGLASYNAKYKTKMGFQSDASYCEVCHPFKFDFKTKEEFFAALGNAKELQKHTISKGVSCEECHGAGGHLDGGKGLRSSNCERCHQRFGYSPDLHKELIKRDPKYIGKPDMALSSKFKSMGPGCGTEGAQSYFTAHYESGMRCTTCHDPHEVSGAFIEGDKTIVAPNYNPNYGHLSALYSKPKLKKTCKDCHKTQAYVAEHADTHSKNTCASCHMPFTMSCENFYAIQFQDYAGFDTQRRSHMWKILVDPKEKTMIQGSVNKDPRGTKDWYFNRDKNNHNFIDLMWACGRTSWADKDQLDTKGCHSPVISELKPTLHFKNQKQVYDEVMGWQNPVKTAYTKVKVGIQGLNAILEVKKLNTSDKARVYELIQNAQEVVDLVKKDGSWGVHGFKYTKQRLDAAQSYIDEAQKIINKTL